MPIPNTPPQIFRMVLLLSANAPLPTETIASPSAARSHFGVTISVVHLPHRMQPQSLRASPPSWRLSRALPHTARVKGLLSEVQHEYCSLAVVLQYCVHGATSCPS